MKYVILLFALSKIILPNNLYHKEDPQVYHNNAEIVNIEKSMRPCNINDPCNCPGGFFINIDGVKDPDGKCVSCNSFKTRQFPKGFQLIKRGSVVSYYCNY